MILDEYRSRYMPNEEIEPFAGSSALGRPRRPRRRSNLAFVAVAALLVLALVWILGRTSGEEGSGAPPPVAVVTSTPPSHSASPSVQPTKSAVPYTGARLVVLTTDPCWLEVRRGDATGAVVYAGTLPGGASKRFRDPQALYVRFGSPAGVQVKVNGGSAKALDATGPASYLVTKRGMTRL